MNFKKHFVYLIKSQKRVVILKSEGAPDGYELIFSGDHGACRSFCLGIAYASKSGVACVNSVREFMNENDSFL